MSDIERKLERKESEERRRNVVIRGIKMRGEEKGGSGRGIRKDRKSVV